MITIRADWTLDVPEEERGIGWAGENEVERRVFVLPEGYGEDWVYRLDLRLADGSADIVLLEPEEGTLTWEITERHLAQNNANYGYVYAQIRADKGSGLRKAQWHSSMYCGQLTRRPACACHPPNSSRPRSG